MLVLLVILAAVVAWLWANSNAQGYVSASTGAGAPATGGNSLVQSMAESIYQFEGGGKPGAANSHNNNPGNIGGGSNTYPTWTAGWNALLNQITVDASAHPGWSFYNFFAHYLTGDPNNLQVTNQGDPVTYANFVAGQLGVSPDQTVSSYLAGG